jgi:hypothetical protein
MDKRNYLILLFTITLLGCDKGISPNDTANVKSGVGGSITGFGGSITYVSPPPPRDSLVQLRVVAVPYYPIDTVVAMFIQQVLLGIIQFSDTLQTSSIDSGTSQRYDFYVPPGEYKYVAVVQLYGQDIFADWRVIAVYGFSQSTPFPLPVTITENEYRTGIDFIVDFKNLPPQPFKK